MAELTPRERLQPCLLDRLTNDTPGATVESRDKRVMTAAQIKASVLRDLSWLLNCETRADDEDARNFPNVHGSVLNFGIPDLCGLSASSVSGPLLERRLTEVIRRFEPRILRHGLVVKVAVDAGSYNRNALVFEVHGSIWAQPIPERLDVKTEVDLETGQVTVHERTTAPGAGTGRVALPPTDQGGRAGRG